MHRPYLNSLAAYITGEVRALLQKFDGVEQEEQQHDKERIRENLPEEFVIESILTKLPVRTLAVCCCVSKSWLNSILHDSRFHVIHNIQNKSRLFLVLNLLNVCRDGTKRNYFFSLSEREEVDIDLICDLPVGGIYEIVGFCNGLVCVKTVFEPEFERHSTHGTITVVNPSRGEALCLSYLRTTGGYDYLCHGFGFDSLSQVYKAVMVFASTAKNEILCMVITLGTTSWRTVLTSTSDILPPPGFAPFPSGIVTRASTLFCRQATFCGGDLFWRTKNKVSNSSTDIEMLLSFDLHKEKVRFVRLPAECALTTPTYEHKYLPHDHLLEFKGHLCIAHSERTTTTSNTEHCGHRCNYQTSVCCCCYKVHMYILEDKDKQVWTREETFDVQIKDQEGSPPTPLCCFFKKDKIRLCGHVVASGAMPRTRILTFSDQVLLYWFNGKNLIVYNLQEKHLNVVECSRSYPGVFQRKMNEDLDRTAGDDGKVYSPSMDYQLHAQAENMVSLETFIPKEAKSSKCHSLDEMHRLLDYNRPTGEETALFLFSN